MAAETTSTNDGEREPSARKTPTDWGNYGRRPLVILALVALIDAVDRGILPGVLDKVQNALHFNDFQAGFLGTAFVITGFLVAIPSGYIADRYRRTRIIAIMLASWGAISALNAAVTSYAQFAVVRAMLGVGETIDNPASQSLIADYYQPTLRGRAYAFQRVAPTVGTAFGTILGGVVAAVAGWRWAFLIVGVPGSLLAFTVWRMPEPRRGEHDQLVETTGEVALVEAESAFAGGDAIPADDGATVAEERRGLKAVIADSRRVLSVPTLRYLIAGTAIASGALAGIGFWGPTFFSRQTSLTSGQAAGVAGGLILIGALAGTLLGGFLTDRLRGRVEGAPMVVAGVTQALGAMFLIIVFLPTPLAVKLPMAVIGVLLIVAGFPALTAMTAEVVPAEIRGLTFSVTGFLSALVSAASPLIIGALADQWDFVTKNGTVKGNLGNAFVVVTPLVIVGALVVLRGRRYVAQDTLRAAARV
jgi:MFS family permease